MRLLQKIASGLVLLCSAIAGPALAQADYPNKPIRWIVPYTPGGTTDILARLMGQYLSTKLGQQVIIENRPGGGNNIGTEMAIRAPADGYTMLLVNPANAINATLYPKLTFNLLEDLAPVAGIIRVPNVMTVTKNFPATTVAEFIAYGKANPGKLNMASPGAGTSPHLSGELFKILTGIEMQHIPYRGAGPAYPDLMTGKVDVFFDNLPGSVELVKSGKLKALGVTAAQRSFVFPEIPTIGETIPGYDVSLYYGVSAPKGTPPDVIAVLNNAMNAALADPKMKVRIAEFGGAPLPGTPADFGKLVADETVKWEKVVKTIGLSIE